MVLKDDGGIESEGKSDDESMPPLEDASDVEFLFGFSMNNELICFPNKGLICFPNSAFQIRSKSTSG